LTCLRKETEIEIVHEELEILRKIKKGYFYSFNELYKKMYGEYFINEFKEAKTKDRLWLPYLHRDRLRLQLEVLIIEGKLKSGIWKKEPLGEEETPETWKPRVYYGLP
jgi:hypothetical protein